MWALCAIWTTCAGALLRDVAPLVLLVLCAGLMVPLSTLGDTAALQPPLAVATRGGMATRPFPWRYPSSAPAPPQGKPGGSGRLEAHRGRGRAPGHAATCLGCSSCPPPKLPILLPVGSPPRLATLALMIVLLLHALWSCAHSSKGQWGGIGHWEPPDAVALPSTLSLAMTVGDVAAGGGVAGVGTVQAMVTGGWAGVASGEAGAFRALVLNLGASGG